MDHDYNPMVWARIDSAHFSNMPMSTLWNGVTTDTLYILFGFAWKDSVYQTKFKTNYDIL